MTDVLEPDEEFAVVIADPPWVSSDDVARYPEDPLTAIDGGPDGLDLVRTCLEVIDRHLAPAGSALLQAGPDQTAAVSALAEAAGLPVTDVRRYERGALLLMRRPPG